MRTKQLNRIDSYPWVTLRAGVVSVMGAALGRYTKCDEEYRVKLVGAVLPPCYGLTAAKQMIDRSISKHRDRYPDVDYKAIKQLRAVKRRMIAQAEERRNAKIVPDLDIDDCLSISDRLQAEINRCSGARRDELLSVQRICDHYIRFPNLSRQQSSYLRGRLAAVGIGDNVEGIRCSQIAEVLKRQAKG